MSLNTRMTAMNAALSLADESWLRATFARNRARFGDLRMEEGDPAPEPPEPTPPVEDPPESTEADKLRAEVEKYKGLARKHETRAKENWDWRKANEEKVSSWDALDDASKTEQQREVDRLTRELETTRAAQEEARKSFGAQLVATKLTAAAQGKGMTPDALNTLAGDPTRFLAEGGVDDEALDAFLAALPDAARQATLTPGSLGGGRRTEAKVSGLAAGAALYDQTHKRRTPA